VTALPEVHEATASGIAVCLETMEQHIPDAQALHSLAAANLPLLCGRATAVQLWRNPCATRKPPRLSVCDVRHTISMACIADTHFGNSHGSKNSVAGPSAASGITWFSSSNNVPGSCKCLLGSARLCTSWGHQFSTTTCIPICSDSHI
jgi:hypothetical protein